jgi:hypothetical protein
MMVTAGAAGPGHGRDINNGPHPRRQQELKMTAFLNTVRNVSVVLAVAASLSAVTSTATYAFSAEAQSQCTGDAFRLCSSDIPNIPKITACMMKNRTNLSSGCRNVMERELAAQKSKVAVQ